MDVLFIALSFICGGFLAVQGPMNNGLTINFGRHPVTAVSFVFLAGSMYLAIVAFLAGAQLPSWSEQTTVWWHWCGGFLGAFYVGTITLAAPRIGIAFAMTLVLLGRVSFSIAIDHFGWVGMAQLATTPIRLLGVALVFFGALLVSKATTAAPVKKAVYNPESNPAEA